MPWVGLHINPQGYYSPCCKSKDVYGENLQEYLNSTKLKNLQSDLLAGNLPPNCQQCWHEESNNLPSLRQVYLEYKNLNDIKNLSTYKVLHLTFGNICNLACRTCGSFSSSKWKTEEEKLNSKKIYNFKKFYKNSSFLDEIKSISSNMLQITFSGGEVFYTGVDQHLDYLDFLISNNASDIELEYITNTTIFPSEEFWNRWVKFKTVKILLSVDAISKRFEYIRYPAIWDECYSNIRKYKEKQVQEKITISISHTISFFNVFYLDEFHIWCMKEQLPIPYLNIVHNPIEFNIQSLPLKVKEKLITKFKNYKILEPVIRLLHDNFNESLELDQILDKVYAVDQLRNENFEQVFPEFAKQLLE